MQVTRPIITLIALLALAAPGFAQQVDLVLKLEPGKVYKNTMTMEQQITQSAGGIEQKMDQTMAMGMSQKVLKKHDNGNYDLATTYDWVTLRQPMMNIDYDSRKAPQGGQAHPLVGAFAGMVGKGFEMTMTPRGKVTELRGIEQMLNEMVEGFPEAPGFDKAMIKDMMKQQFGEEAIKSAVENSTALPDKAVNVGDTWQKSSPMPGVASTMTTNYKLASVEGGAARVEARSTITPDPQAKPIEVPGGSTMKQDLRGTQSGFLLFHTATGWLKRSEMTQEMSGETTMTNPGFGEMKIPMTMKSKIVITDE